MDTKHTPGPWHIIEDRTPGSLEVFAGNVAVCECWRRSDVQTEIANANLIAAAPDLLALLIRYRKETPLGHQPHMIAHEVDAAIAKATGDAV